ncbi:MAG: TIGR04500 family putative peptide maturation system protein [Terriglobales bacterium]
MKKQPKHLQESLGEAVDLLRNLPRERHAVEHARERFRSFQSAHPSLRCDLVVDQPPASNEVDYDLLLGDGDGGTVALSWRQRDGLPWVVNYSDHWAANFVLTVNNLRTSIQSALLYLNGVLQRTPDMMRELENKLLIEEEILRNPPDVSSRELDDVVHAFLAGRGLDSPPLLEKWLQEMGLTMAAVRELLRYNARVRKFRHNIAGKNARSYFKAHHDDFAQLTVVKVETRTRAAAASLARKARASTLWEAVQGAAPGVVTKATMSTAFVVDLPAGMRRSRAGELIGPEAAGDGFSLTRFARRRPPHWDDVTREKIETILFDEWLLRRRQQSEIRWYWT